MWHFVMSRLWVEKYKISSLKSAEFWFRIRSGNRRIFWNLKFWKFWLVSQCWAGAQWFSAFPFPLRSPSSLTQPAAWWSALNNDEDDEDDEAFFKDFRSKSQYVAGTFIIFVWRQKGSEGQCLSPLLSPLASRGSLKQPAASMAGCLILISPTVVTVEMYYEKGLKSAGQLFKVSEVFHWSNLKLSGF